MRWYASGIVRRACLGWLLAGLLTYTAVGREWSDTSGVINKLEGELIKYDGKVATISFGSGLQLDLELERLSAPDVEYLKKTYPNGFSAKKKEAAKKKAAEQDATEEPAAAQSPAKDPEPAAEPAAKKVAAKKPALSAPPAVARRAARSERKPPPRASAPGAVKVEVVALSVSKPQDASSASPGESGMLHHGAPSGTRIQLLVSDSARAIIGMDEEKSKITFLGDDKGTNLKQGGPSGPAAGFFQEITFWGHAPGQGGIVELSAPKIPIAAATRIGISGELHLICASGEKTDELVEVALASGTQIDGPIPMTIEQVQPQQVGEMKLMVTLQSKSPLSSIKKLIFVNAAGAEVPSETMGSGSFGFGSNMTYTQTIGLGEALEKATLRVVSYEATETVRVPLKVVFGVGL